jgi:MFS family permease
MGFRPSGSLKSRTFVGLLTAQFLAAFNDQAIHAAAMFFAFHTKLLNEKQAISLMPILFYAPWAIFCTLAGWCADRFSKRHALVFWKFAEIGICLIALSGFYWGSAGYVKAGPTLVLACVFLMGMHSTFFVPAKYGVMPEILEPQLLSRGNGALESLSFLAVILGTVCGGVLSFVFRGNEVWIGVVLLALAVIGAAASLTIETMPAANPTRRFPPYLYGPLKDSIKSLLSVRPLALAVVGIAFFTFVVVYMRATVYMLGEAQSPRWDEWRTSLVVGATALGIGLGSPLAGWLSGRKIELGLVPLGGIGMAAAAAIAAGTVHWVPGLVACIIIIGFFTGFYLVPLYSLLQHRAPKTSKGDAVAVSNFINVTGAMAASLLFVILVNGFQKLGIAKPIPFGEAKSGTLVKIKYKEGRLKDYEVEGLAPLPDIEKRVVWAGKGLPTKLEPDDEPLTVVEQRCVYRGRTHCLLRGVDAEDEKIFDNSGLPGFLFLGAAGITLVILVILCCIMPDLAGRGMWALRRLRGPRVRGIGSHHIPLSGAMVLATNCRTRDDCRYLRSATDRLCTFVGPRNGPKWNSIADAERAHRALAAGNVVVLTDGGLELLKHFQYETPIAPAYIGRTATEVSIYFGQCLPNQPDAEHIADAIRIVAIAEDDYHVH